MHAHPDILPRGTIVRREPPFAFTLIEILIVVIILGILAAIAVPQFSDASQDATVATLRSTVQTVSRQIKFRRAKNPLGAYPPTIEASWFAGGLPSHPSNTFGVPAIEIDATANRFHPTDKVLKAGAAGAFWYNPTEGVFRARVTDQGGAAQTLEIYNRINDSAEAGDEEDDEGWGRWS